MQLESYQERDTRKWVVFYCRAAPPINFTVRLFPTLDRAQTYYGKQCKNIFDGWAHLAQKFGGQEMLDAYRELRLRPSTRSSLMGESVGPHAEDLPDDIRFNRNAIAEHLYNLIQEVADRVSGINLINEMDDEELFIIRLDRMTQPAGMELIETFNRQKKVICEALIELGKSKAEELELQEMMRRLVTSGRLKTKQEPHRIFRYYAPELGDAGFLYYPSKRHKVDDHNQNS